MKIMYSPVTYFGSKLKMTSMIWERFGNVENYVEPFFGSGITLLKRPGWKPGVVLREAVNDMDCMLVNFWRATKEDPDTVAEATDWPISQADLHARHQKLIAMKRALRENIIADPEGYDAKTAGWWVWGQCQWIGKGWCDGEKARDVRPNLSTYCAPGILGELSRSGRRKLASDVGVCEDVRNKLMEYLRLLRDRMRHVSICCGDWSSLMCPSVLQQKNMTCAVMLDPPYTAESGRVAKIYSEENLTVAHDVRNWCLTNGDHPNLRIALCGFNGEHEELEKHGWTVSTWDAEVKYAGLAGETTRKDAGKRERIWWSPACCSDGLDFG
jgi:DNA adenine methylase